MLWWLTVALGGELLPWGAPWDVQEQLDRWEASRGRPARPLACGALWTEAVRLCFRREVDGRLQRVYREELDPDQGRKEVLRGAAAWVEANLERGEVEGTRWTYRMLRDLQGRAVLGLLAPEEIAAELGQPFLAALPRSGVLLAWTAGQPDLDRVMAVAVKEQYDRASDPVSPVVFGWDGRRWFPFVEAVVPQPDPAAPGDGATP